MCLDRKRGLTNAEEEIGPCVRDSHCSLRKKQNRAFTRPELDFLDIANQLKMHADKMKIKINPLTIFIENMC